jgi:hypothetical protein
MAHISGKTDDAHKGRSGDDYRDSLAPEESEDLDDPEELEESAAAGVEADVKAVSREEDEDGTTVVLVAGGLLALFLWRVFGRDESSSGVQQYSNR